MKGIKKTLVASFLACSALQAQAEMSSFNYGLKSGLLVSAARVNKEVKMNGNDIEAPFGFCINGEFYGEYAFCDYVGAQLGIGHRRDGINAREKNTTDKNPTLSMMTHGITVPLSVYFYPLGREEGEGMLTMHLGGSAYFPVTKALEQSGTQVDIKTLSQSQEQELPNYDFGGHAGLGYQFPFGLILEARYGMNFKSRFGKKDKEKEQTIFTNVRGLKDFKTNYTSVNVGYNLASLFTA